MNLFLIPNTLSDEGLIADVVSNSVVQSVRELKVFVVENAKNARALLKKYQVLTPMQDLVFYELNKHEQSYTELKKFIETHAREGSVGVISDAGCPAIADPGALAVKAAHELGLNVNPLIGPSSIFLALMASGFNGQKFAFNGYLPIEENEKITQIKFYESLISKQDQTQIFIETPYRNNKLLDELIKILKPETYLCIAADITLPTQVIKTLKIKNWKTQKIDLHKRPCIFLLYH